jgi:hypothetical protein
VRTLRVRKIRAVFEYDILDDQGLVIGETSTNEIQAFPGSELFPHKWSEIVGTSIPATKLAEIK